MHDLRKKALLESGKTTSRKSRSRPDSNFGSPATSPGGSRHGSRTNSRAGSRYTSEEEGGLSDSEFDDSMTMSTNSVSDDAFDDDGNAKSAWSDRLQTLISQILAGRTSDRKRIGVQDREEQLKAYLHIVRHYYSKQEIGGSMSDLVEGLMKSIKSGGSPLERSLALRSLCVSILTNPSEGIFEGIVQGLKVVCQDDEDENVKADAVYALCVGAMHGDGSTEVAEDILEFLIEIIESDGQAVGAPDSATVVVAAQLGWGFVASYLGDLSDQSEQAMDAFVEQLDSIDVGVQTGAGSNIALLFESAREYEEETGETLTLRYDPNKLIRQMKEISRGSKSISKRDRRLLRGDFSSIVTSLELGKGPGYSTSGRPTSNPHLGGSKAEADESDIQEFGYREKIRVHNVYMVIDSWSLQAKVQLFRIILAGGFDTHFSQNPLIKESLDEAEVERIINPGELKKVLAAERSQALAARGKRRQAGY